MTNLYFTFAAHPPRPDGTHVVRMYMTVGAPTLTDHPGDERKAIRDVRKIVADICDRANKDPRNDEGLLCDAEMPAEADPIFLFAIGVTFDHDAKLPTYKQIGYRPLYKYRDFARVASVAMELYGYIYGLLRDRERDNRAAFHLPKFKPDRITLEHAHEKFDEFAANVRHPHTAYLVNKIRFNCPHQRNGYCSPCVPNCPCCTNGRCEEMTAAKIESKVNDAKFAAMLPKIGGKK